NMIDYTPNAGHDLGGGKDAFKSLSAFYGLTLNNKSYPECSWKISSKNKTAKLEVKTTPDILVEAYLWAAESENMKFTEATWTSVALGAKNKPVAKADIRFPASGFKAFYLDLKYRDPNGGEYTESTRMFVADQNELKLN
ncbi:MAG: PhoPQ-activated pathogenicity-like protein PqaA type, partial [Chitinophagaceae bacterium]|nr:PhoPQ-activated pathogenicity-like protein PqaA type [Chitinophagaceae bacterium]